MVLLINCYMMPFTIGFEKLESRLSQFLRNSSTNPQLAVLSGVFVWLEGIQPKVLPKSALGKAVNYALNHRKGLSAFLTDGNIALSNNICERAIRNFTIGRKNWLFSASPKGAAASATVYSIVETSKANDLEPFRYLTYLFEKLPNINFKIHPEVLEDFLPWSKEVQQKCK